MNRLALLPRVLIALMLCMLTACGERHRSYISPPADANTVRVGVITGSSEELLLEAVQKVAQKKYDLEVKIVPYLYASELNKALADNEIDVNIFQYQAYLAYSQRKYGYQVVSLGNTYIYPMGIYSKRIDSILQLPQGALIAIPEEPTNETRALHLLEKAGLIRMRSGQDITAGTDDIAANPSKYQFKKFPANQLTSVLPHVDIAVINAGFALFGGYVPHKNALVIENQNSAYANLVIVRQKQARDPRLKALLEIFRSAEIQQAANKIFHGAAIRAW